MQIARTNVCLFFGLQDLKDSLLSFTMTLFSPCMTLLCWICTPFRDVPLVYWVTSKYISSSASLISRMALMTNKIHKPTPTMVGPWSSLLSTMTGVGRPLEHRRQLSSRRHIASNEWIDFEWWCRGHCHCVGLIWVITSAPLHVPVEIHTDCMFGLAGTLRGHSCPIHVILLDIGASLFQTVRMTTRVSCHHLRRRCPARLAGTIRLPGHTAISTDAGPESPVYSCCFARLPQNAERMIAPPFGTNFFSCSLRIPASSQSLPRPLLGKTCSSSPFMLLMLSGLIPKYTHGVPVLANL